MLSLRHIIHTQTVMYLIDKILHRPTHNSSCPGSFVCGGASGDWILCLQEKKLIRSDIDLASMSRNIPREWPVQK